MKPKESQNRNPLKVLASSVMSAKYRAHEVWSPALRTFKVLSAFVIIVRSKLCPGINVHVVKRFLFDNDKNRYPSDIDVSVFLKPMESYLMNNCFV